MKTSHPEWKTGNYPDHPKKSYAFVERVKSKIREKHPEWGDDYFPEEKPEFWKSSREWYNPRRWQGTARKLHGEEIEKFMSENAGFVIDRCPEAKGVNVTGLMSEIGVKLNWQWPPVHDVKNITYAISLAGIPLKL